MKVSSANLKLYRPAFTGNDNVFGYDDGISQKRRNFIQEHYNSWAMPYQSIYESEKRLEEFELKQLLSAYNKKCVNSSLIKNLPLRNVEKISETSYRGSSAIRNLDSLKILKQAGIQRIIDLAGFKGLNEACNKEGLEYFNYSIEENVNYFFKDSLFKSKDEIISENIDLYKNIYNCPSNIVENEINSSLKYQRKRVEQFVDFISTLQKEYAYIGCEYGLTRTDIALALSSLFNPKHDFKRNDALMYNYDDVIMNAEKLYHNLTSEDKLKMQWTKSFDDNFLKNLRKFRKNII